MRNIPLGTSRFIFATFFTAFVAAAAFALGQVINEDFMLLANDGSASDQFGNSIAVDNSIVAVGAVFDDDNGTNSGSAYLFNASTGAQLFKLLPNDGAAIDKFGTSISISGGIVAIGASGDQDNGNASGSAYIFNAAAGAQIAKLIPTDGAEFDEFGRSIAINSNGIIAVGALLDDDNGEDSGSAYLFNSNGAQFAKLLASDGTDGDFFGHSVAIENGVVAVGAYRNNDNGDWSGSAYLFNATTGVQIAKLLPYDGAADDRFGFSIAIADGIVVVGAYLDDDNGTDSGSAYLFDVSGAQIAKLLPIDGATNDQFGFSVSIADGTVAVGAPLDDDNGINSGSTFIFDASTGAQIAQLFPSDGEGNDQFGQAVAIFDGIAAIGVRIDDENGFNSGSAYVFTVPAGADCLGDLNNDGTVGTSDLLELFAQWGTDGPADFDDSGAVGTADLLILFANWGPCA